MQPRSRMICQIALGTLLCCVSTLAQEDPDFAKESRLHGIYKKHNEAPTPEEDWQKVLSIDSIQTYTVQSGDTLWGISETMFGDPQFYPKIWSLNGQTILNPHEINPEQIVQFVEGTVGEPPSMSLAAKGSLTEKSDGTADDPGIGEALQEIPEGMPRSRAYHDLPSSLAPWEFNPSAKHQFNFQLKPPDKVIVPVDVYVDTYLQEGPLSAVGFVSENEGAHTSSGDEQYIFVKMVNPPTQNRFLVVKEIGTIKDSVSGNQAKRISIGAEVELEQVVNSAKTMYRAKVVKLLNRIDVGSQLVTGDLILMSAREDSPVTSAKATIIGGSFDEDRQLFGTDEITYINLGSDSGLAPGQILPVYRNQVLRNEDTEANQNHRVIGRLKIIETTGKFSSAVVTHATEDLRVGDRTYTE